MWHICKCIHTHGYIYFLYSNAYTIMQLWFRYNTANGCLTRMGKGLPNLSIRCPECFTQSNRHVPFMRRWNGCTYFTCAVSRKTKPCEIIFSLAGNSKLSKEVSVLLQSTASFHTCSCGLCDVNPVTARRDRRCPQNMWPLLALSNKAHVCRHVEFRGRKQGEQRENWKNESI